MIPTFTYTLKNPFGLKDGQLVVIGDIPISENGLKCGCICPACGEAFEARMGDIRSWHFAHTKKSGCDDDRSIVIGIYRFIAMMLGGSAENASERICLPPCYLKFKGPNYLYRNKKCFYENFVENPNSETVITEKELSGYLELSSAISNKDDPDAWLCYAPAQDFGDFSTHLDDGSYDVLFPQSHFSIDGHMVSLDEYSLEKGIPEFIVFSAINVPPTAVVISFRYENNANRSRLAKLIPKSRIPLDMACLEIKVDESIFSLDTSGALNNEKSVLPKIQSAFLEKHILNTHNFEWKQIPQTAINKTIANIKDKYEKEHLEFLVKEQKVCLAERDSAIDELNEKCANALWENDELKGKINFLVMGNGHG